MTLAIKPASPALQAVPQAHGLAYFAVCYEGSGTTLHDLSASANNGTVGAIWGTGQFSGPDLNIAGNAANVVILPAATGFDQAGDFGVSCWVKLTSVAAQCFASDYAGDGWAIGCDDANTGKVKFFTADNATSGTTTLSATALTTGTWHHVVCTFTASTGVKQIYINGSLDATSAPGQQSPAYVTGRHCCVGGAAALDGTVLQPTLGGIDAVAIYSYALPASGGGYDSVSGIFADPFTSVRPTTPPPAPPVPPPGGTGSRTSPSRRQRLIQFFSIPRPIEPGESSTNRGGRL